MSNVPYPVLQELLIVFHWNDLMFNFALFLIAKGGMFFDGTLDSKTSRNISGRRSTIVRDILANSTWSKVVE